MLLFPDQDLFGTVRGLGKASLPCLTPVFLLSDYLYYHVGVSSCTQLKVQYLINFV